MCSGELLSAMKLRVTSSALTELSSEGYICITYANSILQWRECIAYIFRMGGLSGTLNHYFY